MDHERARTPVWENGLGRASIRSAQMLLLLAFVWVVTYGAIQVRLLVVPLLIATLIAAAASPVVDWFSKRRIPRSLSVWITLLIGLLVVGGTG